MKKISSLFLLFLILASNYLAFSKPTPKWYKTTVILTDGQRVKGLMFAVTDSTVVIIPAERVHEIRQLSRSMKVVVPAEGVAIVIPADQIESVKVRKTGRGWLIPVLGYGGAFAGIIMAGVVLNMSKGTSLDSTLATLAWMMNIGFFGGIGGGIALMRQPVKKVYPNADVVYPQENLASLKPYTYQEIWK